MFETSNLVSIQAAGPINVIHHANVARIHACMTAKDVMDDYRDRPFYVIIANLGVANVQLPKYQKVSEVAIVPKKIVCIKEERSS